MNDPRLQDSPDAPSTLTELEEAADRAFAAELVYTPTAVEAEALQAWYASGLAGAPPTWFARNSAPVAQAVWKADRERRRLALLAGEGPAPILTVPELPALPGARRTDPAVLDWERQREIVARFANLAKARNQIRAARSEEQVFEILFAVEGQRTSQDKALAELELLRSRRPNGPDGVRFEREQIAPVFAKAHPNLRLCDKCGREFIRAQKASCPSCLEQVSARARQRRRRSRSAGQPKTPAPATTASRYRDAISRNTVSLDALQANGWEASAPEEWKPEAGENDAEVAVEEFGAAAVSEALAAKLEAQGKHRAAQEQRTLGRQHTKA